MSFSNPTLSQSGRSFADTIRASWVPFLVQGLIMMVLGIVAVIWPHTSTLAIELSAGWILLFSGIVGLVIMIVAPGGSTFLWSLLTAALSLLVGILLLWHPVAGTVTLTLLLVGFFAVEGIFQIAAAILHRNAFPDTWGWLLMSGIADLLLVAMIILAWPDAASWVLGLFVGINFITSGLALTMLALAGRKIVSLTADVTR